MIEYFELSARSLSYRKMRTFLTLLGVIIGITAVVGMVSIGEGMTEAIKKQFESFGTNKIIITSSATYGVRGEGLTDTDGDAIEKVIGVDFASSLFSVSIGSEFRGEEKVVTIWAMDPNKAERTFSDVSGYRIHGGRWLQSGDKKNIVIGYKIHDDYYEHEVNLGNSIKIQGEDFRVVGIFQETGDADYDTKIFADLDYVRELIGRQESVTMIIVRVKQGYDVQEVRDRIESLLKKRHEDTEFVIMTSAQAIAALESAFRAVQVVFGGIAAISLIVGGIGIANTMIMNVLERTHEIGVMKAVGAGNAHIIKIFIFEAGIIGLIGGSIGIFLGFLISKIINIAAATALGPNMLVTAVTPRIIALAFSFSFIVGIISGIYPAYKAAKLNPVDALRSV